MKKVLFALSIMVMVGLQAIAQTTNVTGTVTDAQDGSPIPGVSVFVKGTTIGTVTTPDGTYNLAVPNDAAAIVFSFVGMTTQEVAYTGQTTINAVMQSDAVDVDEVIVVAYGTAKKSSFTGSAATVDVEHIDKIASPNVEEALVGTTAGVQVGASSGQPGSAPSIRIRGIGSFNASNDPLYVIDGVPVVSGDIGTFTTSSMNALSSLNPSDIESMTVLKDAAAASLYGSRAANGVILITTKSGKKGKTQFRFKADYGFSDVAYNNYEVASQKDAYDYYHTTLVNALTDYDETDPEVIDQAREDATNYMGTFFPDYDPSRPESDYDWEDALFRKGTSQNYEFSARGGGEKTTFFASLAYAEQEGVNIESDFERYTGRLNVDHTANDVIKLGFKTSLAATKQNTVPDGGYYYANPFFATRFSHSQLYPIYNPDGTFNDNIANGDYPNLVKDMPMNIQRVHSYRSQNQGYVNVNIMEGLTFKSTLGVDLMFTDEDRYWSPDSNDGETHNGYGDKRHHILKDITTSNILNYNKTLNDVHNLDLMVGYEAQLRDSESTYADGHNYPNSVLWRLTNVAESYDVSNNLSEQRLISYLSRFNYNYKDKYYASFSFRRDGSSKLGVDNRWGNFWSVSGSWRVTQESFMESTSGWLNDLKVKASYGVNGTLPNDWYGHLALYEYGYDYNSQPGSAISQVPNPNLSWELNKALNVGVDFTVIDVLTVNLEYFNRTTEDLLLNVPVSRVSGFTSILDNVGSMENRGFEVTITSRNISRPDFNWTTSLTLATVKNEITKLYQGEDITDSPYRYREGKSKNTFFMRDWAGVNPDNGNGMWYITDDEYKRVDEDGDGEFDTTENISEAGYAFQGSADPDLTGGLNNTINYKGFDLSFLFNFQIGGQNYSPAHYFYVSDGAFATSPVLQYEIDNQWRKPGDNSINPRPVWGNGSKYNYFSSRRLFDADYIRLKSLTFGYTLPSNLTKKASVDGLRFYFSALNLWTWAENDLFDPETTVGGQYTPGIPPLKTFTFGVELKF